MRRSSELAPLSREHHQVLLQAMRMKDPAPGSESEVASDFARFWGAEAVDHLAREEDVLIPPYLEAGGSAELVERLRREHAEIREHAQHVLSRIDGPGACGGCLARMGELLHDHVRFEERELFPEIERVLSPAELRAIGERLAA